MKCNSFDYPIQVKNCILITILITGTFKYVIKITFLITYYNCFFMEVRHDNKKIILERKGKYKVRESGLKTLYLNVTKHKLNN